jgi:superfamily I DNA/RNA helicase
MSNGFDYSKYQKDIFKNIATGSGHSCIIARAGASKTFCIVESIKFVPKRKKILVVAFNKSIQEELNRKIQNAACDVLTLHSLGFRAIKRRFPSITVDNFKSQNILQKIAGEKCDVLAELDQCLSLCKATLSDTSSKIKEIIEKYSIDVGNLEIEEFCSIIVQALRKCKDDTSTINFDDMVWFPFVYSLNVGKYDYVMVDEVQDLNYSQLVMVKSAMHTDSRLFTFGDPRQVLYNFRGADWEKIDETLTKLNPAIFSLPICYRCPEKVVELARQIVSDIEVAPKAKQGEIFHITPQQMLTLIKPGDFVLSRTNAPLIKFCMMAIKNGIRANIRGRDIGKNLLSFVNRSKSKSVKSFLSYLVKWKDNEIQKAIVEKRDQTWIIDRYECLSNLCEDIETIKELTEKIKTIFNDDASNVVIFSSVHRAKGDETDNVFVLKDTLKQGYSEEEDNIVYVAITRSKSKLYMVSKYNVE